MSVRSVKLLIQELEGISPDRQRLVFAAKVLEDGHFLADYNIALDSTLTLIVDPESGTGSKDGPTLRFLKRSTNVSRTAAQTSQHLMQIFMQTLGGKIILLAIEPSAPILSLKLTIQDTENVPPELQRLIRRRAIGGRLHAERLQYPERVHASPGVPSA